MALIVDSNPSTAQVSWVDSPTVHPSTQRKRLRMTGPVDIPLFEQCVNHTSDPFWQNLLRDAHQGKFPHNFSYRDGILIYKTPTRTKRCPLSLNPSNAALEFISFLRSAGGISSPLDDMDSEVDQPQRDISKWVKLTKKEKNQALVRFVRQEIESRNLTDAEILQLKYILNCGQTLNFFHKDNIIVDSFVIQSIAGLKFNEETRKYWIDEDGVTPLKSSSKPSSKTKETVRNDTYWFDFHAQTLTDALKVTGQLRRGDRMRIVCDGSDIQFRDDGSTILPSSTVEGSDLSTEQDLYESTLDEIFSSTQD